MAVVMAKNIPQSAYPGLVLGNATQYGSGPGTHIWEGHVCASIVGTVKQVRAQTPAKSQATTVSSAQAQLSVERPSSGGGTQSSTALPEVGSIVLARVTRLRARDVNVSILVVDDHACAEPFQGVVRREDVRGWEVDKVVLGEAFRVGDIVRAVMISLGDQAAYYLSTARNELGVLLATSEQGNQMFPISWKEFKDPETGKTEGRKVAKPV